jgi:organic radical activating enzyme
MPATVIEIGREEAIALFQFIGWKTAAKWNPERMASKLQDVAQVYDPAVVVPEDKPELQQTLTTVLNHIDAGGTFAISGGEPAVTPEETEAAVEEAEAKAAEKAAAAEAKAAQSAEAKAAKEAEKAAKKAAKEAEAVEKKKERALAKLDDKTRIGCACKVMSKLPLEKIISPDFEVTDEMIKAVDTEFGASNTNISKSGLNIVRQVLVNFHLDKARELLLASLEGDSE